MGSKETRAAVCLLHTYLPFWGAPNKMKWISGGQESEHVKLKHKGKDRSRDYLCTIFLSSRALWKCCKKREFCYLPWSPVPHPQCPNMVGDKDLSFRREGSSQLPRAGVEKVLFMQGLVCNEYLNTYYVPVSHPCCYPSITPRASLKNCQFLINSSGNLIQGKLIQSSLLQLCVPLLLFQSFPWTCLQTCLM